MCVFPTFASKICTLVIIPIAIIFSGAEIVEIIVHLCKPESLENILYLNLIVGIVYFVGLCVGFYAALYRHVICIQLMLFVIAAYVLVKSFIWITSMNSSTTDDEKIVHVCFQASFVASVLTFLLAFIYCLRLKELQNIEPY
ncbi:uncharacterized protein [Drosophila kikkawai]|uniref:Uncharacterized protein LOC108078087 n=1 Tax=Drosophila kikkawai TaxID=30033 RepID=A0A6P4IWA2_DROKI|nr:uncharacterized protein LOC108078087 [Drosophila kikkawai]XP_017027176.1 uncharacterized protein LOC108078087 [Drosophila kikkawai]XP_017027185.1 uncharacterized protein LOC108078087 [Drosophila kikkawai]